MIVVLILGKTFKMNAIQWKYVQPTLKQRRIGYTILEDTRDENEN